LRLHLYTGYDKRELLVQLLERGHEVDALVLPNVAKYLGALGELRACAAEMEVPVVVAGRADLVDRVQVHHHDTVLVSAGFPLVLRPEHYERYHYAVNFHPTLLPRHRGKYLNYVLLESDSRSGMTAHLIDEGVDTGPILAQRDFVVGPFDTVRSVRRKTLEIETDFVLDVLDNLEARVQAAEPQDESRASLHLEPRTPEASELDPAKALIDLLPIIRASDPDQYPAYFLLEGEKVLVFLERESRGPDEKDML